MNAPKLRLPNGQQRTVLVRAVHRRRDMHDTLVDIWPGPRSHEDMHWRCSRS
ncbi:MAG TPA: hypothetical protein VFM37_08180 [Pseudonocardiaceae bacterium]|nr:hypothetical protein [Pseudonocardiaceae bacterium]